MCTRMGLSAKRALRWATGASVLAYGRAREAQIRVVRGNELYKLGAIGLLEMARVVR